MHRSSSTKVLDMPAPDIYHHVVKNALIKDGWTITHDSYTLTFGQRNVFVDLGAERLVAAERNQEKIAVEIKSFHGASDVRDLEMALGQYVFYRSLLARFEPGRKLFLAVPYSIFVSTLDEPYCSSCA
jgi:XisH protein